MPTRFGSKGYDFDRLRSVLGQTDLSQENPALEQLLSGLIDGVQKQEARFETKIKVLTESISVDSNGNISARNIAKTAILRNLNTGDVTLNNPGGADYVRFPPANSNDQQQITLDAIDLENPANITGILPLINGGSLAGIYTPTLFNVANVAASTPFSCQWIRAGNTVFVSGRVDVDPTAAVSTQLGISLPITSNFANANECAGSAFSPTIAGQGAAIIGDVTNDRAQMQWIAVDITNQPFYFSFGYRVI